MGHDIDLEILIDGKRFGNTSTEGRAESTRLLKVEAVSRSFLWSHGLKKYRNDLLHSDY